MNTFSKLTILTILSFTLFQSAQAQIGIKAGYNLSSLKFFSDGDNVNEEFISGYQVGLVYRVGLGDKLSIQPEAAYSTNGGDSDIFDSGSGIKTTYQNLKLNGLINYNIIGGNDGIGIHITGGVFASYGLSGEVESNGIETDIDFDDDTFERTNVGYILGAGVKLNRFLVSVRGSFGVTELMTLDIVNINGDSFDTNIKSREFSLVGIVLF